MFTKVFGINLSIWALFTVFLIAEAQFDLYCTVETKNGFVRGIQMKSLLKNVNYFAFRGIPYAEAPIDELRFKVNEIFLAHSKLYKKLYFKKLSFSHQNQLLHGNQLYMMHLIIEMDVFYMKIACF